MMLGKRPRHSMKRTTSLTEFTLDLSSTTKVGGGQQQQEQQPPNPFRGSGGGVVGGGYDGIIDQRLLSTAMGSPRNNRRNSLDSVETPHFLRSCALCKRRLVPGRDIYMYRGDSAFCSSECRQQQMNQDERKDKCSLASKKEAASSSSSSAKSESIAAII